MSNRSQSHVNFDFKNSQSLSLSNDSGTFIPWRLGLTQAKIEIRHRFRPLSLLGFFFVPILVFFMYKFSGESIASLSYRQALAVTYVPIALSMTGMLTLSSAIMADQDDGTLLRAKILPGGMLGYLIGKVLSLFIMSALNLFFVLLAAHGAIGGVFPNDRHSIIAVCFVALLSMVSTIPLGVILGSLAKNVLISLPVTFAGFGLLFISGLFFPISSLPSAVAIFAKFFPVYWLGELSRDGFGARSFGDFFDIGMAANCFVPLLWAFIGALIMPFTLNVLSRRQSGSRLSAIQARRLSRGY